MNLSINQPCSEAYDNLDPTASGGFCQSCQKEVIDFTQMSDAQILNYFANRQTKTCGRFNSSQLKSYSAPLPPKRSWNTNLIGAGLLSFSALTFLPLTKGQGQTREQVISSLADQHERRMEYMKRSDSSEKAEDPIIKTGDSIIEGIVVGEDGQPLIGVPIVKKGSNSGTLTDGEGKFKLSHILPGDVLLFSYIGFVSQLYVVPEKGPKILEITLKSDACVLMGEVSVSQVYTSKRSLWQKLTGVFR